MTVLERMQAWLATYPGFASLAQFWIDYADHVDPGTGGIFPAGLMELGRKKDICGNITVTNQYSFSIYCVFAKPAGDDDEAAKNAEWMMNFQEWVQEQSVRGLAPSFGDDSREELIIAQNGIMFDAGDQGTATYMVQLTLKFIKKYEEENQWLK